VLATTQHREAAVGFEVEVRNVDGAVTALGAAGPFTLVVDRPAPEADLAALVAHVDAIAEIPNSLRQGTPVTLDRVTASGPAKIDGTLLLLETEQASIDQGHA
jgi:hypothetical protein